MLINSSDYPGYDFIHDSPILQRKKYVRIIKPIQDLQSITTIIYLLHPFATNRFFWANFFKDNSKSGFVFVLPESGRNWFINDDKGLRYEDYFISELVNDIELQFPFIKRKIIGGFSMGGAAAFFLALRKPLLFDAAFSISGAFGAFNRLGDPYQSSRDSQNFMIPTEKEHLKVWGDAGSITRETYQIPKLYHSLQQKIKTQFIVEVGLQDYERIIMMNREIRHFFSEHKIYHCYREAMGNHSSEYAYQSLDRILSNLDNNIF